MTSSNWANALKWSLKPAKPTKTDTWQPTDCFIYCTSIPIIAAECSWPHLSQSISPTFKNVNWKLCRAKLANTDPHTSVANLSAGLNKVSNESSCLSLGQNWCLKPSWLQQDPGDEQSLVVYDRRLREYFWVKSGLAVSVSPCWADAEWHRNWQAHYHSEYTANTQPTAIWANWEDWEYSTNPPDA